jgi:hypothetical protein
MGFRTPELHRRTSLRLALIIRTPYIPVQGVTMSCIICKQPHGLWVTMSWVESVRVSWENGLGDHADGAEVVFLFLSPLPSSRLVHYCLDSRGVSLYSLAAYILKYYYGLPLWTAATYLSLIAWHGPGQPGLVHTPMFPFVTLLYWPLQPGPPLDLSTFSSCLITIQHLPSPQLWLTTYSRITDRLLTGLLMLTDGLLTEYLQLLTKCHAFSAYCTIWPD